MQNNDVLRRLREALSLSDERAVAIFRAGGAELADDDVRALVREGDPAPLPDELLARFLDGFIVEQRGPSGSSRPPTLPRPTNNAVLTKLRIALNLQEDDMLRILAAGGVTLSSHELTPLFRKPGHKHFKRCSDQVLASFIAGLGRA